MPSRRPSGARPASAFAIFRLNESLRRLPTKTATSLLLMIVLRNGIHGRVCDPRVQPLPPSAGGTPDCGPCSRIRARQHPRRHRRRVVLFPTHRGAVPCGMRHSRDKAKLIRWESSRGDLQHVRGMNSPFTLTAVAAWCVLVVVWLFGYVARLRSNAPARRARSHLTLQVPAATLLIVCF